MFNINKMILGFFTLTIVFTHVLFSLNVEEVKERLRAKGKNEGNLEIGQLQVEELSELNNLQYSTIIAAFHDIFSVELPEIIDYAIDDIYALEVGTKLFSYILNPIASRLNKNIKFDLKALEKSWQINNGYQMERQRSTCMNLFATIRFWEIMSQKIVLHYFASGLSKDEIEPDYKTHIKIILISFFKKYNIKNQLFNLWRARISGELELDLEGKNNFFNYYNKILVDYKVGYIPSASLFEQNIHSEEMQNYMVDLKGCFSFDEGGNLLSTKLLTNYYKFIILLVDSWFIENIEDVDFIYELLGEEMFLSFAKIYFPSVFAKNPLLNISDFYPLINACIKDKKKKGQKAKKIINFINENEELLRDIGLQNLLYKESVDSLQKQDIVFNLVNKLKTLNFTGVNLIDTLKTEEEIKELSKIKLKKEKKISISQGTTEKNNYNKQETSSDDNEQEINNENNYTENKKTGFSKPRPKPNVKKTHHYKLNSKPSDSNESITSQYSEEQISWYNEQIKILNAHEKLLLSNIESILNDATMFMKTILDDKSSAYSHDELDKFNQKYFLALNHLSVSHGLDLPKDGILLNSSMHKYKKFKGKLSFNNEKIIINNKEQLPKYNYDIDNEINELDEITKQMGQDSFTGPDFSYMYTPNWEMNSFKLRNLPDTNIYMLELENKNGVIKKLRTEMWVCEKLSARLMLVLYGYLKLCTDHQTLNGNLCLCNPHIKMLQSFFNWPAFFEDQSKD